MRKLLVPVLALLLATPLAAQEVPLGTPAPGGAELVDRVVAVVGDTVLLLSDVQAEIQQRRAAGDPAASDPARVDALARQIVEQQVDDMILTAAARAAGVVVDDAQVAEAVDADLAAVRQRFGSEAALAQALAREGLTPEQYRQTLTAQYRTRMLRDRFLQQKLAAAPRPAVSDAEARQLFDAQRELMGQRPANVSFRQAFVPVEPSDSAVAAAVKKAEEVLKELNEGVGFDVLARRFSDDPGTREHGGDLGWFRRGRMVPAFENVVYALRPGQTSGPVKTDFGIHIIRLEKARGTERQARHILIKPEITEADVARARARADSVATAARNGASFTDLARRYSSPQEQALVEHVPLDQLPPAYASAFDDAQAGAVVGPFEVESPIGSRFVVAKIAERQDAGSYTFEDVREQARQRLQEQKMVEQLIEELRGSMYVAVHL
jgi:peptidyl-prolyl cis-trans isomerase SurA